MTFWLRHITRQRSAWLLLGLSAVFLEVCALLFQHVLGLRPCLMCIYERLVVIGLLGSSLIALIDPAKSLWRWGGLILWGLSIYRGLQLSLRHVDYLLHPSPFNSCSFFVFSSFLLSLQATNNEAIIKLINTFFINISPYNQLLE